MPLATPKIQPARYGWTPAETIDRLRQHRESPDLVEAFQAAVKLSRDIAARGGRSFLVGGAVRDEILNEPPHDIDLEVHGLSAEQLAPLLEPLGKPEVTGKSFGVYNFRVGQTPVQIAHPRRDSRVGDSHRAFEVEIVPDLGIVEAARRRDFTIGAISKDILTGEIYDPFHGIDDLRRKILRMVDAKTFGDDALRVLRGARFAAKFGLAVEPETLDNMRTMVERIGVLSKERLREEWLRILTDTPRPSVGIEVMQTAGVIERWHPQLAKLWQTEQDPQFHSEGNVGPHTMMAVDAAAELSRQLGLNNDERREVILGALTHDFGKPLVTTRQDNHIISYGHEAAGVKPAEEFMSQIGVPTSTMARVTKLVAEHARPGALYQKRDRITDRALRKLARDIGPNLLPSLITVAEADHRGRGPFIMPDGEKKNPDTSHYRAWWQEQITRLALDQTPEPILWGHDLLECGWPPGPQVGEALRLAQDLATNGGTRQDIEKILADSATPTELLDALRQRLAE